MIKKALVAVMVILNTNITAYGAGMNADAINKAEFFSNVNVPGVSDGIEGSFENNNIFLDLSYETIEEQNLWTVKVLYTPGEFIPEVVEITTSNGYIHSMGLNSGSALIDSNGYEYMICSFNDSVGIDIVSVGVYYNSTTSISETLQNKVPEYNVSIIPNADVVDIEEGPIPEVNMEPENDIVSEEIKFNNEVYKSIENEKDEVNEETNENDNASETIKITEPIEEVQIVSNENIKQQTIEQPKQEVPLNEPMAEVDIENEIELTTETSVEQPEDKLEIIESKVEQPKDNMKLYKWYNIYIGIISLAIFICIKLYIKYN